MIAVMGENIIDLLPRTDGLLQAQTGGSPFNFAIACARAGAMVCYLSPISHDHYGDLLHQRLHDNQVHTSYPTRSQAPSSLAVVTLDAQGQPSYSLYRQGIADRDYTSANLMTALPEDCAVLHLGSLALEPADASKLLPLLTLAAKRKVKLSIDINVRLNAVSDATAYRAWLNQIVAQADLIKASDEDLMALYPTLSVGQAIEHLRQLAPHALMCLTFGADGATVYAGAWHHHQAAVPPKNFVDTVGAGDTFYANFISYLQQMNGLQQPFNPELLQQALKRASVAASINISRVGCQPPSRQELESLQSDDAI